MSRTHPFAGFTGFPYKTAKQTEVMLIRLNGKIRRGADEIADHGEELEQDGHRVRFGMRLDGVDNLARESVKG